MQCNYTVFRSNFRSRFEMWNLFQIQTVDIYTQGMHLQ